MCNTRRFHFSRKVDVSGVSGIGEVAFGIMFSDGSIALHWEGSHSSIGIYKSEDDLLFVHGHGSCTDIVWDDPPVDTKVKKTG
jgi:hypothetical protein